MAKMVVFEGQVDGLTNAMKMSRLKVECADIEG